MMKTFLKIAFAVAAFVLVTGCCACRKGKNNLPLLGTQWQLVRLMGRDLAFDADKFVFTFNGGEFVGMGACNRFMGKYAISDTGALKIEDLASTRMMCPDAEVETEFSQVMNRATHYEVDGNLLLILSNGEMQAVLQAL